MLLLHLVTVFIIALDLHKAPEVQLVLTRDKLSENNKVHYIPSLLVNKVTMPLVE